jgi:hypothetical protein
LENGAEAWIEAVVLDAGAVARADAYKDYPAERAACDSLRSDTEAFQAYQPSPDPEHASHIAAELAQFARGATDCIAGANTGSSELLSTSRGEIDAAFAERGQANARLKIINGN